MNLPCLGVDIAKVKFKFVYCSYPANSGTKCFPTTWLGRLRKAIYFPAITALRCSPFFQEWADGLRQRGKSKMSVIGAGMR